MNVVTAEESVNHILVLAQMRHNAQFNLWVVGGEEFASVIGNEGFTDFFAVLVTNGDILQVRIAGTESSGSGHRLIEGGMDTSRTWVYQLRQCIDIGA